MRAAPRVRHTIGSLVLTCSLASCSSEENAAYFPTWPFEPGGAVPGGVLKGTLTERNGCLLLSTGDGSLFLLLWPDTYRSEGSDVVTDSDVVLSVGDFASLVGGGRSLRQAEAVIRGPIPMKCRMVEGYWLVAEVAT
jgi:hypothetical protein